MAKFCVISKSILDHCSGTEVNLEGLEIINEKNGKGGRSQSRASCSQGDAGRQHSRRACRWPHVSHDDCEIQDSGKVSNEHILAPSFTLALSTEIVFRGESQTSHH